MSLKTIEESTTICPKFERTFSILGKKWNGMIIDSLLSSPLRFKDISTRIPGISDRVLVDRLKTLEYEGLVKRVMIDNTKGYSLSEKGYDLEAVMLEVQRWADEWVCDKDLEK
ncbi:MAG TPA: helix-turn-helix domain-containing protein [Alloiococcus sp.]|uniref:winged helix-turn-helix transcriptional regulator n=1 Tax=Phocicoccus schoeneichii TaxID=1812261 RepID=UPI002BF792C4|nr:helix-turn-helix domain-containing protein [Alloiococcus sp.]